MCRGKKMCSELSEDPKKWDLFCPLRPPIWMEEQIDIFVDAVDAFVEGDKTRCLSILESLRNDEMQTWYIEHGQMSGKFRKDILRTLSPSPIDEYKRDPLRAPKKYQNKVFVRDGYRCRYCGGRLIDQKFIKTFIEKVASSLFRRGETNIDTHGIIHMTWPVADHVIPWNLGGRTDPSNLVSSCAACNYGKYHYTLEQMGLENPFHRPPICDYWDGLLSKIKSLKDL